MMWSYLFVFSAVFILSACQPLPSVSDKTLPSLSNPTSKATALAQQKTTQLLDFNNEQDFIDANKGLIASAPLAPVKDNSGHIIWDNKAYDFVNGEAPSTVNPSLWRQEKLNNIRGLFQVSPGIYQLRGFDLANMTIIEGITGWTIVDPLTSKETAQVALAFAQQFLGVKPIKAIIFTHAHIDHFGGILGIVTPEQITEQEIRIIAPEGFMEAATSENILVGVAMARRSAYMYGKNLPRNSQGHIGSGLGTGPAFGTFGIVPPTEIISDNNTYKTIDGIDYIFQNASGTESVAEITFYLPKYNAFCGAELVSRNMHNLYTLRGAQVRNALQWSNKIDEALQMFGTSDIYFGSHQWPVWGNDKVTEFLTKQRDMYKFIHDQSVRLINQGLTSTEIAERLTLPDSLAADFSSRGYYGSLSHNAKAVYQYYMGWFDANPAHLNPLPEAQSAELYVEMMGGAEQILSKAYSYFEQGNYRWVAQLLNHLIFTDPDNKKAKDLLARSYEQLAYQAESAAWRNMYLSGAQELKFGVATNGIDLSKMKDIFDNTPVEKFFESMSVRLNSEKANNKQLTVAIYFSDLNERYLLSLSNSVLHHTLDSDNSPADVTLTLTHDVFVNILIGKAGIKETLFSDQLSVDGSIIDLVTFFMMFDKPDGQFNIVTP